MDGGALPSASVPFDGACNDRELGKTTGCSRLDDDVLRTARGATVEDLVVFLLQLAFPQRTRSASAGPRRFDLTKDFRTIETDYRPHFNPPNR